MLRNSIARGASHFSVVVALHACDGRPLYRVSHDNRRLHCITKSARVCSLHAGSFFAYHLAVVGRTFIDAQMPMCLVFAGRLTRIDCKRQRSVIVRMTTGRLRSPMYSRRRRRTARCRRGPLGGRSARLLRPGRDGRLLTAESASCCVRAAAAAAAAESRRSAKL